MRFVLLVLISLCYQFTSAQIMLNNPSFEDEPADATVPMGWFACERGTTPDILPGPWGVDLEAEEGETFVGLITRIDGTFESIGQRLSTPLEADNCYTFFLSAASCDTYSGFNRRISFRIYAGNRKCKKSQLLYSSKLVENKDWEVHKIEFTPEKKFKYITIEAFNSDTDNPIKGHILIDNMTSITPCSKV